MDDVCIVTGAAGFIGSHLCSALLARGEKVVGIDNFDPFYSRALKQANLARLRSAGFTEIEADIRDREKMADLFGRQRPRKVFHLAALAGVRPSIADPQRYVSVNLDGLTSVLDAARLAGCRECIFASSSSVYGNNTKVPFAETDPVDEPISPYAATKRAGELICHSYAHLFAMRIVALRFFTVFGPAQRPDLAINSFMRKIALGEDVPMFGDGTSSRDYTFIDDIIRGVLAAGDRIATTEAVSQVSTGDAAAAGAGLFRIYNLGGSQPIDLRTMIKSIARVVGKPARIKPMPMQPGDVERTWADVSRSRTELNFLPRTSFEQGLGQQWEWMRTSGMLQG
jgi:UDP-glucuronate 4-epimerase